MLVFHLQADKERRDSLSHQCLKKYMLPKNNPDSKKRKIKVVNCKKKITPKFSLKMFDPKGNYSEHPLKRDT